MLGANAQSKKALKEKIGTAHQLQETSAFGPEFKPDGANTFVGPCPFTNRKFYGTATYKDGILVKVV